MTQKTNQTTNGKFFKNIPEHLLNPNLEKDDLYNSDTLLSNNKIMDKVRTYFKSMRFEGICDTGEIDKTETEIGNWSGHHGNCHAAYGRVEDHIVKYTFDRFQRVSQLGDWHWFADWLVSESPYRYAFIQDAGTDWDNEPIIQHRMLHPLIHMGTAFATRATGENQFVYKSMKALVDLGYDKNVAWCFASGLTLDGKKFYIADKNWHIHLDNVTTHPFSLFSDLASGNLPLNLDKNKHSWTPFLTNKLSKTNLTLGHIISSIGKLPVTKSKSEEKDKKQYKSFIPTIHTYFTNKKHGGNDLVITVDHFKTYKDFIHKWFLTPENKLKNLEEFEEKLKDHVE